MHEELIGFGVQIKEFFSYVLGNIHCWPQILLAWLLLALLLKRLHQAA